MSTSYFVYCESCNVAVTDPNGCDHGRGIIGDVVERVTDYMDLMDLAARLPDVRVEFQGCGCCGFSLEELPKHRGHRLRAVDEYGYAVLPSCSGCGRDYCAAGDERDDPCCDKCTHEPVKKLDMGPLHEGYYAAH